MRVVLREEAVRLADGAGSAGAPDAVHVVLRLQREVVDEHERDAGNVQPARGDVRGDQHGRFAFAEQIQGVLALGLVFVAVHATVLLPHALILRSTKSHRRLVPQNTMPRAPSTMFFFKTAIARSNLLSSSKISTVCVMLVLAVSRVPPAARTCVGS